MQKTLLLSSNCSEQFNAAEFLRQANPGIFICIEDGQPRRERRDRLIAAELNLHNSVFALNPREWM
jgi:hypothetical protein